MRLKCKEIVFSTDISDGNYDVELVLGDNNKAADTLVTAQGRRRMLNSVKTTPGEYGSYSFTVNVRGGRLRLSFLGENPALSGVEVKRAENVITLFLAGDSTVCDQEEEPWAGWGQMLPCFFKKGIAVSNHAESGRAVTTFFWEKRLDTILHSIKENDFLFIQFGHNDQKPGPAYADPETTYREYLKKYIIEAKKRKATPVLVTSMHRRSFDEFGKIRNTLGEYPSVMREMAREHSIPLIDLHRLSETFFNYLGPEKSKSIFVHVPPEEYEKYPGGIADDTHFCEEGALKIAQLLVKEIGDKIPTLKKYIR